MSADCTAAQLSLSDPAFRRANGLQCGIAAADWTAAALSLYDPASSLQTDCSMAFLRTARQRSSLCMILPYRLAADCKASLFRLDGGASRCLFPVFQACNKLQYVIPAACTAAPLALYVPALQACNRLHYVIAADWTVAQHLKVV